MHGDDFYIYKENGRIIEMKDVDKYINKIGTWRENISSKKLVILILSVLCLLGVGIFCAITSFLINS